MRIEQLTFTRFLAAISIVVFHYGKNIFPFNYNFTSYLFKQANIGVSYFFILSGFVMIIAYGKKKEIGYLEYLRKRFARIYPVYLIAILILLAYYIIQRKQIDYTGLLLNLTVLQSWVPGYALAFNSPGWSIAVEFFFYLTFPFLFNHIYSKYPVKKLVLPVILIFMGSQLVLHVLRYSLFYNDFPSKSHDFLFYFPLMHFNEFLIGNIVGLFFILRSEIKNYDWAIVVLVLILIVILKFDFRVKYDNGMLAFIFVPLIILISSNNGLITKVFNKKIAIYLGEISYGIYILQKPIQIWINGIYKLLGIDQPALIFYSTLLILIIVSGLSYTYIETPLREWINKKRLTSQNLQNAPAKS